MSLLDKIAIVTGGGSGIGEAVSQELARRGATVVVADINSGDASRVAEAIRRSGGRAEARQVDVSSEDAVRQMVEETAASHGRLDYLFNNAGIGIGGDARDLTSEHWRRVLGVDLFGVIYGTLAAYPIMTRQGFGHIVNTSSAAGLLPGPFNAPYNTSKHAVVGLSLSLRIEAADLGVKVSVICPGFVRTSIYQTAVTVNIPQDKARSRLPAMMEPPRAAQLILDGVEKNQAVIVFPASIRWVWRAYRIAPTLISHLLTPLLLKRIRELRSYRLTSDEAKEAAGAQS
jgi:NAD(P)-dependent dehydrogenase (short-subunit alcohol dehydrogenase family)